MSATGIVADLALVFSDEARPAGDDGCAVRPRRWPASSNTKRDTCSASSTWTADLDGLDAAASIPSVACPLGSRRGLRRSARSGADQSERRRRSGRGHRPRSSGHDLHRDGQWRGVENHQRDQSSSPNWTPLTDQLPSLSTSAITIDLQKPADASKPRPVYVGTGECQQRRQPRPRGATPTAAIGVLRTLNGRRHVGSGRRQPAPWTRDLGDLRERQVHGRSDPGSLR